MTASKLGQVLLVPLGIYLVAVHGGRFLDATWSLLFADPDESPSRLFTSRILSLSGFPALVGAALIVWRARLSAFLFGREPETAVAPRTEGSTDSREAARDLLIALLAALGIHFLIEGASLVLPLLLFPATDEAIGTVQLSRQWTTGLARAGLGLAVLLAAGKVSALLIAAPRTTGR